MAVTAVGGCAPGRGGEECSRFGIPLCPYFEALAGRGLAWHLNCHYHVQPMLPRESGESWWLETGGRLLALRKADFGRAAF
jgi:hypothetical protein